MHLLQDDDDNVYLVGEAITCCVTKESGKKKKVVDKEYIAYSCDPNIAVEYAKARATCNRKLYVVEKSLKKDFNGDGFYGDPSQDLYGKEIADYYNVYMTENEYAYWAEAWEQYLAEMVNTKFKKFVDLMNIIQLNKKEAKKVNTLLKQLSEFHHDYTHGVITDVEEFQLYFDYEKALQYFVDNIL